MPYPAGGPGKTEEFSITQIFDALFKSVSEKTKVPAEDYSAIFGGQLYAGLIDAGLDIVLKPVWSAVLQALIGSGAMLYSTFAEGVSPRLRKELFSLGTHSVLEIIDPASWMNIKASAEEVGELIKEGDYVNAIFKPPEEILKTFGIKPKKKKKETKKKVTEESTEEDFNVEIEEEEGEEVEEEEEEEEKWRRLSA